ncbi:hypothetical protein PCE1_004090 [Barthelona sp. PCE]
MPCFLLFSPIHTYLPIPHTMNNTETTALIVIDVQNDFASEEGSLFVSGGPATVPNINEIMEHEFFAAKNPIIATQDWHPTNHCSFVSNHEGAQLFSLKTLPNGIEQVMWPVHCVQNTKGSEYHPDLNLPTNTIHVKKGTLSDIDSYSAFFDNARANATPLHGILTDLNVKKVICVGIATDYCVKFSALDAVSLGYETHLILNCVAGVAEDSTNTALEELKEKGVIIHENFDMFINE